MWFWYLGVDLSSLVSGDIQKIGRIANSAALIQFYIIYPLSWRTQSI